jgi:hypothetical protein
MSDGVVDMKIDPSRAKALSAALQSVSERVGRVAGGRNVSHLISLPVCGYNGWYGVDV